MHLRMQASSVGCAWRVSAAVICAQLHVPRLAFIVDSNACQLGWLPQSNPHTLQATSAAHAPNHMRVSATQTLPLVLISVLLNYKQCNSVSCVLSGTTTVNDMCLFMTTSHAINARCHNLCRLGSLHTRVHHRLHAWLTQGDVSMLSSCLQSQCFSPT